MAAAQVSLFGIDPMAYLREKDQFVRATMDKIAEQAHEMEERRDLARASKIANAIGQMLFGKK